MEGKQGAASGNTVRAPLSFSCYNYLAVKSLNI